MALKTIGNITVIDDKEISSNRLGWNEAIEYAKNLSYEGDSSWRLPTIDELQAIYDNKSSFENADLDTYGWFWSSEEDGNDAKSFYLSQGFNASDDKIDEHQIICVKG